MGENHINNSIFVMSNKYRVNNRTLKNVVCALRCTYAYSKHLVPLIHILIYQVEGNHASTNTHYTNHRPHIKYKST